MLGVIILAAGKSTRMQSKTSKIFHEVCGKKIIDHVIDAVEGLKPEQIILVINPEIKKQINTKHKITFAIQEKALGTGDALVQGIKKLDSKITKLLILCGDTPLITTKTLKKFIKSDAHLSVLGMTLENESLKKPYGRLVIENNVIKKIVEMKDTSNKEQQIPFANTGIYFGNRAIIEKNIKEINNKNNAHEFYLTDLLEIMFQNGEKTSYFLGEEEEFLGINNRNELAQAEHILQTKLRAHHMKNGVTLKDPKTTYFSTCTQIENDTTIFPNVYFGKNVYIESGVTIFPNCYLENCTLKSGAKVGPFAHLRGNTILLENAEVGNFVEVKNSTLGEKTKVKHLSYIGDTTTEKSVNIGAGTITCNYDGKNKHKTIIENNAFIGSNTALVAPITIGENAIIAAGSTITENVKNNTLAIARQKQISKKR